MGVDLLRYPCRTSVRFYKDSNLETPVCWYLLDDDARPLPYYTRFGSGLWSKQYMTDWDGIGEAEFARLDFGSRAVCCRGPGNAPLGTADQFANGVFARELPVPDVLLERCPPCYTYTMPVLQVNTGVLHEFVCVCCCIDFVINTVQMAYHVDFRGWQDGGGEELTLNDTFSAFSGIGITCILGDDSHGAGEVFVGYRIKFFPDETEYFLVLVYLIQDGGHVFYRVPVGDWMCTCDTFIVPQYENTLADPGIAPPYAVLTFTGCLDGVRGPVDLLGDGGSHLLSEGGDNLTTE